MVNKITSGKIGADIAVDIHSAKDTQAMDDSEVVQREYTLGEVSSQVGVHRVTLLRMEQDGRIPTARWRRKPQPHRVYNAAEIDVIAKIINERGNANGRQFVED